MRAYRAIESLAKKPSSNDQIDEARALLDTIVGAAEVASRIKSKFVEHSQPWSVADTIVVQLSHLIPEAKKIWDDQMYPRREGYIQAGPDGQLYVG